MAVREDPDFAGPALEFLLDDAFDGVRGSQAPTMMLRQCEHGESFRNGIFQPCGESGCGVTVGRDELVERRLGFGKRAGIPNGAQFGADAPADGRSAG